MMRVALVTGSSRGIGAQCARALAKEGYAVCINCVERTDKAEALAEELKANGANAIWQQADVADALQVREMVARTEHELGHISLLVNNAGCGTTGNIGASASSADVMRVVDLNVRALTMVTQTVVPFMTRGAKIINVSSIAAFCPTPRMTVYSASKAYVSAFTGGIADELRPKGISVTAVCPGPMKTEFFDAAGDHDLFGNIPWCDPVKVVAGTIRAAKKGRTFYTPTAFNKFYRFVAKILPMKWMIKATRV